MNTESLDGHPEVFYRCAEHNEAYDSGVIPRKREKPRDKFLSHRPTMSQTRDAKKQQNEDISGRNTSGLSPAGLKIHRTKASEFDHQPRVPTADRTMTNPPLLYEDILLDV